MNERDNGIDKWIKTVKDDNIKNYIQVRIIPQMEYYSKTSRDCKKKYMRYKTVIIVLGALIPVAALLSDYGMAVKVMIALLGTSVSSMTAYLELHNYHALWVSCRMKREQLLSILMYYFTGTGVFALADNEEEKSNLFIENCEQCLSEEHKIWGKIVEKEMAELRKDEGEADSK